MGRSDGLGTDETVIQPETEGFEDVASNNPSNSFQLRVMSKGMVSRSALLSWI